MKREKTRKRKKEEERIEETGKELKMTNIRKRGIGIAGASLIILLLAMGYWTYLCLNPSRE